MNISFKQSFIKDLSSNVCFMRVKHRKDIYKIFP